jgi:hypothetical protein
MSQLETNKWRAAYTLISATLAHTCIHPTLLACHQSSGSRIRPTFMHASWPAVSNSLRNSDPSCSVCRLRVEPVHRSFGHCREWFLINNRKVICLFSPPLIGDYDLVELSDRSPARMLDRLVACDVHKFMRYVSRTC